MLEQSGLKKEVDCLLAYSPEREDPGNEDFSTSTISKIVGADTPEAREMAVAVYEGVISEIVPVASSRTAEAIKLTENIFRSVNIAMVNELKVIFDAMDIDVWDVIDGAATKPFGYMPFYPGPGLGGHCIPIDPFYLTYKAREYDVPTRFIELAGEITLHRHQNRPSSCHHNPMRSQHTHTIHHRLLLLQHNCMLLHLCNPTLRMRRKHHRHPYLSGKCLRN